MSAPRCHCPHPQWRRQFRPSSMPCRRLRLHLQPTQNLRVRHGVLLARWRTMWVLPYKCWAQQQRCWRMGPATGGAGRASCSKDDGALPTNVANNKRPREDTTVCVFVIWCACGFLMMQLHSAGYQGCCLASGLPSGLLSCEGLCKQHCGMQAACLLLAHDWAAG